MPYVDITPMGVVETARCIRKIQEVLNAQGADVDYEEYINEQTLYVSQAPGSLAQLTARI
jgi:light-independent protochlorophyllide reductase subunit B